MGDEPVLHNFSWVLPDVLAGLAMVGRLSPLVDDVRALRERGITLLATLTREVVAPEVILAGGIEPLHLPVQVFRPPSIEQLDVFVTRASQAIADGGAVAVHCLAGIGRTGTFLAAYLTSMGLGGEEAIHAVRHHRPGSIETVAQERAVRDFAERA